MKRVAIGCIVGLGLVLGGAASAQAGEINGKGERIPGAFVAAWFCAFSGKDTPDAIEGLGPGGHGDDSIAGVGSTQSYGNFVRFGLKSTQPSPGFACNPNSGFGE